MKSNVIDMDLHIHARTEKAIKVSDDGDRDNAVWLPLSEIEIHRTVGTIIEITLPEWLALDKGLI